MYVCVCVRERGEGSAGIKMQPGAELSSTLFLPLSPSLSLSLGQIDEGSTPPLSSFSLLHLRTIVSHLVCAFGSEKANCSVHVCVHPERLYLVSL